MILRKHDSGSRIRIEAGETITIYLEEMVAGGYCWDIDYNDGLVKTSDNYIPGNAPGAQSLRELKFRSQHVGNFELRLKHWRPWEGDTSIIDDFKIQISVI